MEALARFKDWVKDKDPNQMVSCCVLDNPKYEDYLGPIGKLPVEELGKHWVIDPALLPSNIWLIDLVRMD